MKKFGKVAVLTAALGTSLIASAAANSWNDLTSFFKTHSYVTPRMVNNELAVVNDKSPFKLFPGKALMKKKDGAFVEFKYDSNNGKLNEIIDNSRGRDPVYYSGNQLTSSMDKNFSNAYKNNLGKITKNILDGIDGKVHGLENGVNVEYYRPFVIGNSGGTGRMNGNAWVEFNGERFVLSEEKGKDGNAIYHLTGAQVYEKGIPVRYFMDATFEKGSLGYDIVQSLASAITTHESNKFESGLFDLAS